MASQGERIARIEERVSTLTDSVKILVDKLDAASDSRRALHREQEQLRGGIAELGFRMSALQSAIDNIRPTTEEYLRIRQQVTGAGKLGRYVWQIGKWLLVAAGWLVAAYTYMTGRPPP